LFGIEEVINGCGLMAKAVIERVGATEGDDGKRDKGMERRHGKEYF
jgi:hypothetical protein